MNIRIKPLSHFVLQKPNAGVLLFLAAIIAMFFANSSFGEAYFHILDHPVKLQVLNFSPFTHHGAPMSLLSFVNDAMMAIFFFVVGLEIKQELLVGELSSFRKALLPIIAACGGMVVPVLLYLSVCHSGETSNGATIPMATDIAFALAILSALGKRVPIPLKIFLMALAIVDDIGGIIIIAIFYSSHIAFIPLLISLAILAALYLFARINVEKNWVYYMGGFIVWMLFLESGIHPTIAGVVVAFTVPARPIINLNDFAGEMRTHLEMLDFSQGKQSTSATMLSSGQVQILNNIHNIADKTISPLQSMTDQLNPFVNYLLLPLFAFVNAGVRFDAIGTEALFGVPTAIFIGLFAGKTFGIYLFSLLSVKMKIAPLPYGVTKWMLLGVSMIGGVGFTVSLFIANLSFAAVPEVGANLLNEAKLGIFAGSVFSGLCGYLFLFRILPKNESS